MGKMLEAFANDDLLPGTRFFKRDSEFGRALKRLTDAESALLASLGESEKKLFVEMAGAQSLVNALTSTKRFVDGYKIGVLMTTEVFLESDKLLSGGEE